MNVESFMLIIVFIFALIMGCLMVLESIFSAISGWYFIIAFIVILMILSVVGFITGIKSNDKTNTIFSGIALTIGIISLEFILFLIAPTSAATFLIIILLSCIITLYYTVIYYHTKRFKKIKKSIQENTIKCNELNEHIETLKNAYINIKKTDYGNAGYIDTSTWNCKSPKFKVLREAPNVYECSLSVFKNASVQPFKYICKYFNIKANEETLEKFESILNDFSAAKQGITLLQNERNEILQNIKKKVPFIIFKFGKKRLFKKLGFDDIDFSDLYFPRFIFHYVSPGGNKEQTSPTVFDIDMLDRFIKYLSDQIKYKKSVAGQRALMTSSLREKIKIRDNYTCQKCGLSTRDEPNLLLEIDHKIPLAKGGMTTEDNLQTLCWKCNRSKGAKLEEEL